MLGRIVMQVYKCEKSDRENAEKYIFKDGEKELGYGYFMQTEINPIDIFIHEEFRSKGYGKELFLQMIKVAKDHGVKAMMFQIGIENYRIINIIASFGALNIGTSDGIQKWVLPIDFKR